MNFDDDDDIGGLFDSGEVQGEEAELENAWVSNAVKDYTILAIDCHVSVFARGVETKTTSSDGLNTHNNNKQTISQLSFVIQSVNNYLRSQIIQEPEKNICVLFYNTGHFGNDGDGIYVMKHQQSNARSTAASQNGAPLGTLTKHYIKNMLQIENLTAFSQHIGFSPYLEGTTPFSSLIQCIQRIFSTIPTHHQAASSVVAGTVKKSVLFFTAIDDPCHAPAYIFRQRLHYYKLWKDDLEYYLQQLEARLTALTQAPPSNITPQQQTSLQQQFQIEMKRVKDELDSISPPIFRGSENMLQNVDFICRKDFEQTISRLESTGDDLLIDWVLYPIYTALPDIQTLPSLPPPRMGFQNGNNQNNNQNNKAVLLDSALSSIQSSFDPSNPFDFTQDDTLSTMTGGTTSTTTTTTSTTAPNSAYNSGTSLFGGLFHNLNNPNYLNNQSINLSILSQLYDTFSADQNGNNLIKQQQTSGSSTTGSSLSTTQTATSFANHMSSKLLGVNLIKRQVNIDDDQLAAGTTTTTDDDDNVMVSLSPQHNETITSMSALLSLYPSDRMFLGFNLKSTLLQSVTELMSQYSRRPGIKWSFDSSITPLISLAQTTTIEKNNNNQQQNSIKLEDLKKGGTLYLKKQLQAYKKLHFRADFFERIFPETNVEYMITNYSSLIREFRELTQVKQFKKRALCTVPFIFPTQSLPISQQRMDDPLGYFLGVDIIPQFIATSMTTSTDVKLDPTNKTPIASKTRLLSITGEELNPQHDIQHYFPFGGNEVAFFSKQDMAKVKNFGPGALRILGFKQHQGTYHSLIQRIQWGDNVQRAYQVAPNDIKYPGSIAAFADFLQTLYVTNRIVVGLFTPKRGAIPRLVYLIPQLESCFPNEEKVQNCLQMLFVPYNEDLRALEGIPPGYHITTPNHIIQCIEQLIEGYTKSINFIASKKASLSNNNIKKEEIKTEDGVVAVNGGGGGGGGNGNDAQAPATQLELEDDTAFYLTTDAPVLYPMKLRNILIESLALGLPAQAPPDQLALPPEKQHVDAIVEELYEVMLEEYQHFGPPPKVGRGGGRKAAAVVDESGSGVKADGGGGGAKKAATTARGRKAVQALIAADDDDDAVAEEKPKPAQKRGRAAAVKKEDGIKQEEEEQPKPKRQYNRKKKVTSSSEEESSSDEEIKPKHKTAAKKTATATSKKKMIDKDEDSSEEEEIKPKKRQYNRKKKD